MSTTDELIHASAIVEDHICEQEQRGEKMGSSRELLAQMLYRVCPPRLECER